MNSIFNQNRTFSFVWVLIVLSIFISGCRINRVALSTPELVKSDTYLSTLDKIIQRGFINIGTTGDFMPFTYQIDENPSKYYGIDIELGKDLAKSLGVEAKFVKTSWPSLISDLENNLYDICMSGVTIKLHRQKVGLFTIPSHSEGKAPIARDADAEKYISIESINQPNVRVIVNPGGTNESFATANFPNAQIIHNKDNLSIFQRIVDDEADVMVTDAIETIIQEMIHPELEAVHPEKPFNYSEKGYLMPRDLYWKAYVDQWLHMKLTDGSYQKIFDEELLMIRERLRDLK